MSSQTTVVAAHLAAAILSMANRARVPPADAVLRLDDLMANSPWFRSMLHALADVVIRPGDDADEAVKLRTYAVGMIRPEGAGWAVLCGDGAWQFLMCGEDALDLARDERAKAAVAVKAAREAAAREAVDRDRVVVFAVPPGPPEAPRG